MVTLTSLLSDLLPLQAAPVPEAIVLALALRVPASPQVRFLPHSTESLFDVIDG